MRESLLLMISCAAFGCSAPMPGDDAGARTDVAREAESGAMSDVLVASDSTDSPVARDVVTQADVQTDATSGTIVLPPPNAGLDYQLGGAYAPPAGVGIVSRDRNDPPAPGIYNVCYVNGFQSQPDEANFWTNDHPELILRDAGGNPVVDTAWGEMLLDIRTPASRAALATIVNGWIAGCAASGFNAVEIDNLDSYSRSGGLLTMDEAVAFIRLLSDAGHAHGLAVAQKNSVELLPRRSEMGTDFAVAESCNQYSECGMYVGTYGQAVLLIEYRRADFTTGCSAYPNLSIVLRDLNLVTPSNAAYVFDGC